MSSFDDMLKNVAMPTSEDVKIELPERRDADHEAALEAAQAQREQQQRDGQQQRRADEEAVQREVTEDARTEPGPGTQGGQGTGGSAGGSSAVEAVQGPPPAPQRDEPDEGGVAEAAADEDETAVDDVSDAGSEEGEDEEESAAPAEVISGDPEVDDLVRTIEEPEEPESIHGTREGTRPGTFTRGQGFTHESEETIIKRFPKQLVDRLRVMVGGYLGDAFAEQLSGPALVTAFISARLGVPFEVDDNTAQAAAAFRELEPQLGALESRVDELVEAQHEMSRGFTQMARRVGALGESVEGMELSTAYVLVDRVVGMRTEGQTESNIRVDDQRILRARENIRARTKAQRMLEETRKGRRIS